MKLISIQRSVHRVIIVQQVLMSHLNAQLVHLVELQATKHQLLANFVYQASIALNKVYHLQMAYVILVIIVKKELKFPTQLMELQEVNAKLEVSVNMDLRELRNAHQVLTIQIQKQEHKQIVQPVHLDPTVKEQIYLYLLVNVKLVITAHQGQQLRNRFQLTLVIIHLKELVLKLYVTMDIIIHLLLNQHA